MQAFTNEHVPCGLLELCAVRPFTWAISVSAVLKTAPTVDRSSGPMPQPEKSLPEEKREMEKKLHNVLLEFERSTGLAVITVEIHRLDEGRVLPITSEALTTKVELIG